MNIDEAQARVREVHRIMERTTLYTLLPGTPAIVGGALALAGCLASVGMIRSADFQDVLALSVGAQVGLCVMWGLIGVVAVMQEIVWTRRAARRLGISPMARPARFALFSLSPSLIVAVVLTLRILLEAQPRIDYIVPIWMMCYGTGVYAAGLFSVRPPRLLGLGFIVLGAVGLLWFAGYGVILAGLSFGLLHVVFGLWIRLRSQETSEA